ncbi:hypothetical protein [Streptomyces sp. NPDC101145]|uniref:hypothetical protein n=1 Tax=Streptomyces sp. NPDC101145 TaxID=3366112 RepID=UPI0037F987B5
MPGTPLWTVGMAFFGRSPGNEMAVDDSAPRWEAMRADVLAGPSLTEGAEEHLAQLVRGLHAGWRQPASRLPEAGDGAKVDLCNSKAGGTGQGLRPLRDPDAVEGDEGNG